MYNNVLINIGWTNIVEYTMLLSEKYSPPDKLA